MKHHDMTTFKIVVKGIVQGVGFRYFTKLKADEFGLYGTVQNLADGSVSVFCQSKNRNLLMNFLHWLHNGPQSATVESLHYEVIDSLRYGSFEIKR